MPRKKPYTDAGIERVPCFRCGKPSSQQWQICSLNNEYKGVCAECDIALNQHVLAFFGIPKKEIDCLIEMYKRGKH